MWSLIGRSLTSNTAYNILKCQFGILFIYARAIFFLFSGCLSSQVHIALMMEHVMVARRVLAQPVLFYLIPGLDSTNLGRTFHGSPYLLNHFLPARLSYSSRFIFGCDFNYWRSSMDLVYGDWFAFRKILKRKLELISAESSSRTLSLWALANIEHAVCNLSRHANGNSPIVFWLYRWILVQQSLQTHGRLNKNSIYKIIWTLLEQLENHLLSILWFFGDFWKIFSTSMSVFNS